MAFVSPGAENEASFNRCPSCSLDFPEIMFFLLHLGISQHKQTLEKWREKKIYLETNSELTGRCGWSGGFAFPSKCVATDGKVAAILKGTLSFECCVIQFHGGSEICNENLIQEIWEFQYNKNKYFFFKSNLRVRRHRRWFRIGWCCPGRRGLGKGISRSWCWNRR